MSLTSTPDLPTPLLSDPHPTPTHCGLSISSLYYALLPTLIPLLSAAACFMGFRALATVATVSASTLAGTAMWRLVAQRGRSLYFPHALYLSLLLACLLPADLARLPVRGEPAGSGFPLLVAAGFTLATLYWLSGGIGTRLNPVPATALLLISLFPIQMTPAAVLARPHLFTGDLLNSRPSSYDGSLDIALSYQLPPNAPPALQQDAASARLADFTHGSPSPDGAWLSIDALLRDRLPPLEDLLLGGHPAPLGQASIAAVFLGGLLLLYRAGGGGGADWRVPLFILASALGTFICFRLPIVIQDSGPVYRWLAFREPGVPFSTLFTFALYQMAAGPLVFAAFFLATSTASAPTNRSARTVYATLLGIGSAAAQLCWTPSTGPLAALLVISLLSPALTRLMRPRPLL